MNFNFLKQRFIFLFGLCILFLSACGQPPADSPEMARSMLKLRGYQFNENDFFRAVRLEDAAAVKGFLQAGINPNAKNDKGETALTFAIGNTDQKIMKILVDYADLNMRDETGAAPLQLAVLKQKDELVNYLLEKKPDVNIAGRDGRTTNQTPLFAAVVNGDEFLVKRLLDRGANPNIADSQQAYPLSEAVVRPNANLNIVRLLLERGADAGAREKSGNTALIYAASNRRLEPGTRREIIRLLIEKGADETAKNDDGMTAFDWAKKFGFSDVYDLLK